MHECCLRSSVSPTRACLLIICKTHRSTLTLTRLKKMRPWNWLTPAREHVFKDMFLKVICKWQHATPKVLKFMFMARKGMDYSYECVSLGTCMAWNDLMYVYVVGQLWWRNKLTHEFPGCAPGWSVLSAGFPCCVPMLTQMPRNEEEDDEV